MMPHIELLKKRFFTSVGRPGVRSILFGLRFPLFGIAFTTGVRYRFERALGFTAHIVSDRFINGPIWTAFSGDFSVLGFGALLEVGVITGRRNSNINGSVAALAAAITEDAAPADAVSEPILDSGVISS